MMGMPYHWANVPRSGCRFVFWVMLPVQVELWELTGRAEMSALRMLLAGKKEQPVPGRFWAEAGAAARLAATSATSGEAAQTARRGVTAWLNGMRGSRLRRR